jgi:murein DD-endopeptidase MepM/ murein hydrolase activator NlpD
MTLAIVALAVATAVQDVVITVAARAQQPGELVVVTLSTDPSATDVQVRAFGQLIPVYQLSAGTWQALIGIDIDQRPGEHPVVAEARVNGEIVSGRHELKVLPKRFPTRQLSVSPEFVDPPASMADRIASDSAFLASVYARSAVERLWSEPFLRPVPDPANSRFGSRSIFNGKPRNAHAGTDFLSAAGVPVGAPNAGRVVAARDLYFSGNTVVIDHGAGLFSLLAHLSRIDVKEGDLIDAGHVVGLVGATGRVTGPHLHWAVRAGGARVDAMSLLQLLGPAKPARAKPRAKPGSSR